MIRVLGVDAWTRGWVAVALRDGTFQSVVTVRTVAELLVAHRDAAVVGIDVPIGFPEPPASRAADVAAKRFVGPRRSSVFMTPPREIVELPDYALANARCRSLTSGGLSRKSFAFFPRILEVDALVAEDPRLHEVHPEASFRELAGSPLAWPKRTWGGVAERRRLLRGAGIDLPDRLGAGDPVPVDDVLDAAAAAWSADRIARGAARTLPIASSHNSCGRPVVIWV